MAGIIDRPFSRRAAVHECQVELLVLLARELIELCTQRPQTSLAAWFKLPEYRRFSIGAYAAGVVCGDLGPMNEFAEMSSHRRESLSGAEFNRLRHWMHTLLRAERWADGYSSPIREAIVSGILRIVVDRLESDQSLRKQDVSSLSCDA